MNLYEDQVFEFSVGKDVILEGSEFFACEFLGLDLSSSSFNNSRLLDCKFSKCNLSNISLLGSTLRGTVVFDSKVLGVNFSNCNSLSNLSFERSILDFCSFQSIDLPKIIIKDSSLKEVDMSEGSFVSANFSGSDLSKTFFSKSDLSKSDFRGAKNYFVDPQFTNIKKAKFSMPEAMSLLSSLDIAVE